MARILSLSAALAMITVLPALGDEVPFAAPPLPVPGQPSNSVASLAEIMGQVQLRHIKLWNAIKFKNWGLLDYEVQQTKDGLSDAAMLYRNIPVDYVASAVKPLTLLQKAAKAKDISNLKRGFDELTAACNSCHQAAGVAFILIKTPTSSQFSDQEFAPG
jgi:mono/diheme cytochrome c family protein